MKGAQNEACITFLIFKSNSKATHLCLGHGDDFLIVGTRADVKKDDGAN